MRSSIRIALIGYGKIAIQHHLPSLAKSPDFEFVAVASLEKPQGQTVPSFRTIEEMAASDIDIDAVAICTPPQVRHDIAYNAIANDWHVLLEKPPGATLSEVKSLQEAAEKRGVSLFASWHSRYAAAVEPAKKWLKTRRIEKVQLNWREDAKMWHPGQFWLWEPGGLGVFDPGINGLSIVTRLLDNFMFIDEATLYFPNNQHAPIAAKLSMRDTDNLEIIADFDFRQKGRQMWEIEVTTSDGVLLISRGGSEMAINGEVILQGADNLSAEYESVYRRFRALIRDGASDVDVAPLALVADAFMRGRILQCETFHP